MLLNNYTFDFYKTFVIDAQNFDIIYFSKTYILEFNWFFCLQLYRLLLKSFCLSMK